MKDTYIRPAGNTSMTNRPLTVHCCILQQRPQWVRPYRILMPQRLASRSLASRQTMIYTLRMSDGKKVIAENRKARFDYFVEEKIECGIVLEGTEVKSVKSGNISFPDAFAEISGGEILLKGVNIAEYSYSSIFNHDPLRHKKLLLHKAEIKRLTRKTEMKGYTLIPLEFYLKNGKVKVLLALCKGKKQFDKKAAIKERDIDREIQREFRREYK